MATVYDEKNDLGTTGGAIADVEGKGYDDEDTKDRLYDGNYPDAYAQEGVDPALADQELEEDSPYPEVRAAVSNTDDPTMPVNTFRMWFLGFFWCIIIAGVNQFFFFRYPSVTIPPIIAQLLAFPMGRFMAKVLPNKWGLNPGPFNIKEHTMITIMAGVSYGSAYATDIIAVQRFYYNQVWSYGYQLCLVISTQMIGFCLGGMYRKFLVWPSAMVWPGNLVNTALFNTLHSVQSGAERKGMSRERFFTYTTLGMFFYCWLPNYLFTAVSYFDWVTWIAPNNQKVNVLFGYVHGAGMSVITFDWGQMSAIGNPMATPWWATANILGGFVFFIWFLCPVLYYSNQLYWAYLPFSSSTSYDRYGSTYNVTRIINPDASLNVKAYEEYSPLLLGATFSMSYGLSFASLSSVIVHTVLYYRKQIWTQARRSIHDADDIHLRLMAAYPEVPQYYYLTVFLINMGLGIAAVRAWPTELPIWAFFLALIISIVMSLPIGIIQAITNTQVGLNVITEMIVGFAVPGKPVSMMIFKTFGYITMAQGMSFISDMKLGHYMKVRPRVMFWGQCWATLVAAIAQVFVQAWMFDNIDGICNIDSASWWCPSTQTFGTASIIWGVIGPQRTFGTGGIYNKMMYFWLIGAGVPIPCYLLAKRYPQSFWKYINFPVIFSGTGLMPPYLPINFLSYCYCGFVFQYVLRRRHFSWWSKYNYVLSAAWTVGYALNVILIFFALQFPKSGAIGLTTIQSWWGNTVYDNTLDAAGVLGAAKQINASAGEYFGPPEGSWH